MSRGLWLGILTNILGGTSYVLVKLGLSSWPPATLVLVRSLLAWPVFALIAPRGGLKDATRADWVRMILVGSIGSAAPNMIGTFALTQTGSLNAGLLVGLEPVTIVVASALFLREPLRGGQVLGFLTALFGAAVVVAHGDAASLLRFDGETLPNLMLAIHAMLWATYTLLAKPTLERVPAATFSAVTSAIAIGCVTPFAATEWSGLVVEEVLNPRAILLIVAMGVGISALAVILWNMALTTLKATEMAPLVFIQPVAAACLSLLIGESAGWTVFVGGALVLVGVFMAERN